MRTQTRTILAAALVLLAAAASLGASTAAGASNPAYAPVDRPGPALAVPTATLRAALQCSGDFTANALEPVLLSPGTGVTPDQDFSWNYERAFTMQGRPWCALTMPEHTLGDIQIAGEYLVFGIRTEAAMAHRRIAVLGHSQGGMSMRWALRFWPDTRTLVDDVIGMAGDNRGTDVLGNCVVGLTKCPAADWQQSTKSQFIAALNSGGETFAGVSYTEIFTHTDEVVEPNSTDASSTSALHTGAGLISNIATQDVCPLDLDEHLLIGTIDPVAYAIVMDALNHTGPAVKSRISRLSCLQLYQPGVDPLSARMYEQILAGVPGLLAVTIPDFTLEGIPELASEPPLACYVLAAGC